MQDRIPKLNGKNNILKSGSMTSATTFEQFRQMMIDGTFYADVKPNNATTGANAGVDVVGTPLNKATLLTDETASKFGLGVSALPDDVFAILGVPFVKWDKLGEIALPSTIFNASPGENRTVNYGPIADVSSYQFIVTSITGAARFSVSKPGSTSTKYGFSVNGSMFELSGLEIAPNTTVEFDFDISKNRSMYIYAQSYYRLNKGSGGSGIYWATIAPTQYMARIQGSTSAILISELNSVTTFPVVTAAGSSISAAGISSTLKIEAYGGKIKM